MTEAGAVEPGVCREWCRRRCAAAARVRIARVLPRVFPRVLPRVLPRAAPRLWAACASWALALATVLLPALRASPARADLPGTLPLAAAGDGHLWWVVKVEPPSDRTRGTSVAGPPTWALMHHAVDEPSPTERLVMRFAAEPSAIAASGQRVVVVTRGERGAGLFITTMFAVKNEAVGHWFTMPRGMPIVLPEPPVDGDVRATAVFGDTLALLLRVRRVDPRSPDQFWLGTVECESGVRSAWVERPLPAFDLAEPVRMFARGAEWLAMGAAADAGGGARGGALSLVRWNEDGWTAERLQRAGAPIPPRGVLGGFAVANRTVIVERVPSALDASALDASSQGAGTMASGGGDRAGDTLRVGILRDGQLQPWAEFAEPARPWFAGPFGPSATVVTVGSSTGSSTGSSGGSSAAARAESPSDASAASPGDGTSPDAGDASAAPSPAGRTYASLRSLSFASSTLGPEQSLAPPGFASGGWIHLPIIGVLSVALVLAAVIFGSDAYLERRSARVVVEDAAAAAAAERPARTARGASLGRRAAALLIDMLPGMVFVWFFVRGTPFDLLQIPAFQPDLKQGVPSLLVFGSGWLLGALGDVLFGRSMGKRIVGLRIIAARGGPATVGRRALRALASSIAVASPVVMLLAFLHPRGDGPAEMLTGTAVVDASEVDASEVDEGGNPPPRTGDGQNRPD